MSVRRARREIDSVEFTRWKVLLSRIEPFGPWRSDLQAGIVASIIANANRGKNTKPFNPTDFMPDFDKPDRKDQHSPAEFNAKMQALRDRFNKQ